MAKHPVPKKKLSHDRSARRYATFVATSRKKLGNVLNVTSCEECGAARLVHFACKKCGSYRGRSTRSVAKTVEKVTKIKA